jgi:hypothetical protein
MRGAISLTPWLQPSDQENGFENETVSNGLVGERLTRNALETVQGMAPSITR